MKPVLAFFALAAAAVMSLGVTCFWAAPPELATVPGLAGGPAVSYDEQVRPVLESRCVVCHGCYDAPCQLQLSSWQGLDRGASKDAIYHGSRLIEARPSRLFIDAQTTAQWRERGFFAVSDPAASPSETLLVRMLALGRTYPPAAGEKLPESMSLDISRELSCPTNKEFAAYARREPWGGMPYGMAPLSDAELTVLGAWLAHGAPPPDPPPPLPDAAVAQVARWEEFLNGPSLKQRITARYLYEHWFLAHLALDGLPEGPFFRVVRSTTAPGQPVREIASRRPYDDPGVERFWYRLEPVRSAIVHKTHIVYALDEAKLERLSQLFLGSDWEPTRLPSYPKGEGSNPFVSFAEIPAGSRYQFLLDDAHYFIMTFIRGPVCRGQVAVDVIQDHFFVAFLDPAWDLSVVDPHYLEKTAKLLALPGAHESSLAPRTLWLQYNIDQARYLDVRQEAYDAVDPQRRGPSLDAIWDGDGKNPSALLTVFRHFDNATVVRGFVGEIPKTAWVLDFPIFERIYYDLVADFDVFGNVTHQVSTRLYMDHLRMQSENLFLAFLPEAKREPLRASWYQGATSQLSYRTNRLRSAGHGTQIRFETDDVVAELLEKIAARNRELSGSPDRLNRCQAPPCDRPGASPLERRAERALQRLAGVRGPWVASLPELSLLRVRSGKGAAVVYALAHNRAHTNVAAMFDEDERLVPEEDTVTIVRGTLGSYPNFLFDVDVSEIDAFVRTLIAVTGPAGLEALVARWGVRRSDPAFWEAFDWIHEDFRRREPTQAGLLDLNRYENL